MYAFVYKVNLNPISFPPPPRLGGSQDRMSRFTAAIQKPLILRCPILLTFGFFDNILAKSIKQEVAAALLSSTRLKHFKNDKIFLCLEIAETDKRCQFLVWENDSGHKHSSFQVKSVFRGIIFKFDDLVPFVRNASF